MEEWPESEVLPNFLQVCMHGQGGEHSHQMDHSCASGMDYLLVMITIAAVCSVCRT
jgi:hypothetical protein